MHKTLLFAFLALATPAVATGAECSLKTVAQCDDTGALAGAKGFEKAVDRFAGKQKVRWLGTRMTLSDVVQEVIGMPADDGRKEVAPGLYRFAGSRPHSAMERGAVFVAGDGTVKAAGVLNFDCTKSCGKTYVLAVIVQKPDPALETAVRAWADEQMRQNADAGYGKGDSTIGRTDLVVTGK
ncbi:hypothetical protein [Gellertiella hungarica]|uniref:Uncharacterized protein n=1 Tax=Gellertiella hungarica TaxID=1572859 RepID=A0A7W6NMV9_9HYPH|nr:hypothetical protein [Gellertiella hungarica]MBB4066742.1 hypothetical protein [Gellertiella hungarica]